MARQVLENGVVLPSEYSDDWYDDMTSNLTKLDDVIGSDSKKLSSSDVGAAALSNNYNDLDNLPTIPTVNDATLTIQKNGVDVQTFTANASSNVTANITVPTKTSDLTNDSNFVDTSNPAVSSGITSAKVTDYDTHIADTDIHVTTADKATWNTVTSKANDSDVVHKSGDETVGGVKTFTDNISTKKIISNVAQLQINARSSADSVAVIAGADASEGSGIWLYGKDNATGSDCRMQIYNTTKSRYERVDLVSSQFLPTPSGEIDCGGTSNKWKSINGINPGALSLPDFSNAIDISSYISVTGGSTISNSYTPPTDGYISVNLGRSSGAIGLVISNGKIEVCVRENTFPDNHRECGGFIPVQKNDTVVITSCLADSIIWAYFIPCQGNV